MLYSFGKNFKDLPDILPLFPLKNVLLLPRAKLPLNLFENRYLHMFDFALKNARAIGMIQPFEQSAKNSDQKNPPLYKIGCAGHIAAFSETDDNRYEIILNGMCRFKIKNELNMLNGFRKAKVSWSEFKRDLKVSSFLSSEKRQAFEEVIKKYLEKKGIRADWEAVLSSADEHLVNSISMGCPFNANEKQALLEAKSLEKRVGILCSLIEMQINENKVQTFRTLS